MSEDEERPPAEQERRFQFLRRGTGTEKYNKIAYITRKSSESQMRPPSSIRTFPSTSTFVDINIPRPQDVPPLQLSPPVGGMLPDSGRGSAAPQEQIYAIPSNRSVESGYGGYQNSYPSSHRNEDLDPSNRTNDYSEELYDAPQAKRQSSHILSDNEIYLPNVGVASPALSSFMRHERDIELELNQETRLSTPTRELREAVLRHQLPTKPKSQASTISAYSESDNDSIRTDKGPLNSTPISFVQNINVIEPKLQKELVIQNSKETPILRRESPTHESSANTPLSSATSIPQSFQIESSSSSISLEKHVIAPNDRPLREAFPEKKEHTTQASTATLLPSLSTQYHQIMPDNNTNNLRKIVVRNQERQHRATLSTSSEEAAHTPLRKLLPKTTDPVVKECRRQLRYSVTHLDLGHTNLQNGLKQLQEMKQNLEEKISYLTNIQAAFEAEKEEAMLNIKRDQESYRKDRQNLERRENEFRRIQAEKDKENNEFTVANRTSLATMRIQLNKKDQEIKRLSTELEAKDNMKVRLERTLEQQRINHTREIKKCKEQISDLETRLSQFDSEKTRRRNGLQSRKSNEKTLHKTINVNTSFNSDVSQSVDLPSLDSSQQRVFPQFNDPRLIDSSKKQVHFDLDRNLIYKDVALADRLEYHQFICDNISDHPKMGLCRHLRNVDNDKYTYMYDLKHVDGSECSAKLYKYWTNDAKWVFSSLEIYLFHKYPLVVAITDINIQIRVFEDSTEIIRGMEISRIDRIEGTVTEVLRKRLDPAYYSLRFSTKNGAISSIYGDSDRTAEEDRRVIRRGNLQNPEEFMEFKRGEIKDILDVYWMSHNLNSSIKEYRVVALGGGITKITLNFQNGEIIDICACPEQDWIIIRHKDVYNKICCDLGKASRDRERKGIFESSGKTSAR